jgi:hypothetical protein
MARVVSIAGGTMASPRDAAHLCRMNNPYTPAAVELRRR